MKFKIKKFFGIVFLLVLIISSTVSAVEYEKKFDPLFAGVLSWYGAGLGQIYTKDYVKGATFFLVDNVLLFLTVNAIANVDLVINENFIMTLNISLKDKRDIEYHSATAMFFLISFITFHSYNVFDSVYTAIRKNRNLPTMELEGFLPNLKFEDDKFCFVWQKSF